MRGLFKSTKKFTMLSPPLDFTRQELSGFQPNQDMEGEPPDIPELRKEAHLVQYDAGEWHQLESLLDEARTHWKMLTFQASYDRKLHHKVSEYRNLWETFSDALTLLRKGRHV